MVEEIRKDVIWYEWCYKVSSHGRIKRLAQEKVWNRLWGIKERIMNPPKSRKGYLFVRLLNVTIHWDVKVHRLVALHFIPNVEQKPEINHKNGIKSDNRVENLEWCTHSENIRHRYEVLWQRWHQYWKFWKDHNRSKPVLQYTENWEVIWRRDSLQDAQRLGWFSAKYISLACRWIRKSAYWHIWKFE